MSNLENRFVKLMVTGPVKQYEVFLLSSMKSFCSACTKNLKAPPTVACINFIGKGGSILGGSVWHARQAGLCRI